MTHRSIAKSASVIGVATLGSRILGFLRDVVIAKFFGTALFAQAFVVAFRIPNLLRDVVGEGATNAAFVPVLSEYRAKKTPKEYWELAAVLFKLLSLALLALTLLGVIFAPLIVRLIAPGFIADALKLSLTIKLTRIMFPYIFLIGLSAYAMGVLNSLKHFAVPAWGPSLLNIAMILSAIYLGPRLGEPVMALAIGVLLGGILQLGSNLPVLIAKGFRFRFKEKPDLGHAGAKKVLKLLLPRALGTCVYQASTFVDIIMASLSGIVGDGGVAALYYSNRIIQFPMAIFGVSLAQAALPTMSEHASLNDFGKLRQTLSFSLRGILLIMIPSSVGLLILGRPIIRMLFERGQFDVYSTNITASALFFYAFGLFAYAGVKVLVGAFYSMQDTLTPVKTASVALCANVILNLALMFPLKIGGIALATSIAASLNFLMLWVILRKKIGTIGGRRIITSLVKMLSASFCMGIICFSFSRGLFETMADMHITLRLFALCLVLSASIAAYVGACFLFKVEEMKEAIKWVLKKS
ncbi:MAG: murein biosynthesis integral membrane protein MurJ [Candidatus Omnitrophota bacterium]